MSHSDVFFQSRLNLQWVHWLNFSTISYNLKTSDMMKSHFGLIFTILLVPEAGSHFFTQCLNMNPVFSWSSFRIVLGQLCIRICSKLDLQNVKTLFLKWRILNYVRALKTTNSSVLSGWFFNNFSCFIWSFKECNTFLRRRLPTKFSPVLLTRQQLFWLRCR